MLERSFGLYHVQENAESFVPALTKEEHLSTFIAQVSTYKKVFRDEMHILAMSAQEIADGLDFREEELMSVIGKKRTSQDEMYQELLEVFRANPLNQHHVPRGFQQYMKPLLKGKL